MLDPSAELAFRLEATLLESLSPALRPIVGAYIEQRKISTFLKKASEEGDETLLTSLVDPNKKRGVFRSGPRVEMLIETLSPDGTVTAACERIVQPENSHMGMVNLLKEFMDLLGVMTTDHEGTKRNIRGCRRVSCSPALASWSWSTKRSPVNQRTRENRLPVPF